MSSIKDLSLHDSQVGDEIPKACPGKVLLMNDRISDLSNDILLHIISSLTLKEAGRTSVLSKRWRHVWAYVPHLKFEFDGDKKKYIDPWTGMPQTFQNEEETKFFRWVDQVVSSHRAHTIDDFMVRFRLLSRDDNIDKWLRFAMEKKVKRLQLDLVVSTISRYTFSSLIPWKTLTSLELGTVDVTGETLRKCLSDCQNLESLSVENSFRLVHLRVVDPLKLKHLKISNCLNMKSLEVSAPNLISFHYHGNELSSPPLKSTPKLSDLYVGFFEGPDLLAGCSHFSSYIPQLEALSLITKSYHREGVSRVFPVGPKLKMLYVSIRPQEDDHLFILSSLIHACPVLQRLEIRLYIPCDLEMHQRMREAKVFPHLHLKILKISGFVGCDLDVGFATYLIKTFVSLEKITIKVTYWDKNRRARAKEEAERLRSLLKPGTELEIDMKRD